MTKSKTLIIYSLEGCPYSRKAEEIARDTFPTELYEIVRVDHASKSDIIHKNNNLINTFPQIFYQGSSGKQYLLGGCSDLEEFITLHQKISQAIKESNFSHVIDPKLIFKLTIIANTK